MITQATQTTTSNSSKQKELAESDRMSTRLHLNLHQVAFNTFLQSNNYWLSPTKSVRKSQLPFLSKFAPFWHLSCKRSRAVVWPNYCSSGEIPPPRLTFTKKSSKAGKSSSSPIMPCTLSPKSAKSSSCLVLLTTWNYFKTIEKEPRFCKTSFTQAPKPRWSRNWEPKFSISNKNQNKKVTSRLNKPWTTWPSDQSKSSITGSNSRNWFYVSDYH